MKILYHNPFPNTLGAGRPIYNGYRNAFIDKGHEFSTLTNSDNQEMIFSDFSPDIFITSLSKFCTEFLDYRLINNYRKRGLKVFCNTPYWKSPYSRLRFDESPGLCKDKKIVKLIKDGLAGDFFYNSFDQTDIKMDGFEKETGMKCMTLLLAADKTLLDTPDDPSLSCDISFIGSYLPEKRSFINRNVLPLGKKYNLKLYSNDLTKRDRFLIYLQKIAQYFDITPLKSLKKNNISFEQEINIIRHSKISLNVHGDYQRLHGTDFNDKVFKIPLYGGFQIGDYVSTIGKYLVEGEEIVLSYNDQDWYEKIEFYMKNPEKRYSIIQKGQKKVLAEHTYHNRVDWFINLYKKGSL